MSKRRRFIITSILLSAGFVSLSYIPDSFRFISISALVFLTMLFFAWSLWGGIEKNATLLTLVLPFFFTGGVGLFWFLLPSSVLTRIPIVILFGIGIYALCLTANIYTVSAIRTIALLRTARGVGFVLTLFTFFLVYDTIFSLKWPIYFNFILIFVVSFFLFLQGYWSITLEQKLDRITVNMALISALVVGEIALALFFWPVSVVVGSLSLTSSCYLLLGLGQAYLEERFFSQTVREYLLIGAAVLFGMIFATQWGGN